MILVSEVTANIRVSTVSVIAFTSIALTVPRNTRPSCFLGLAGVWSDAAGAFVLEPSARDTAGIATRAAAKRLRTAILEVFVVIMVDGLFDGSLRKAKQNTNWPLPIQLFLPHAFGQQFCDVSRQIFRQQRQRLALR